MGHWFGCLICGKEAAKGQSFIAVSTSSSSFQIHTCDDWSVELFLPADRQAFCTRSSICKVRTANCVAGPPENVPPETWLSIVFSALCLHIRDRMANWLTIPQLKQLAELC